MGCRDGACEFNSRMKRDAPVSVEQRIAADLWLKEYLALLVEQRPDLYKRVVKEENSRLHV